MTDRDEVVEIQNMSVVAETEKAFLVCNDQGRRAWIPKSVVWGASDLKVSGEKGTLTVKKWFARQTTF